MSFQAAAKKKESLFGAQRTTSPTQLQLTYSWGLTLETDHISHAELS
jgi:hypothetical protein